MATRTISAKKSAYTIKQVNGEFRVYDAQQRYRCKFEHREDADRYVNGNGKPEATQPHPFPQMETTR
jgi:viroplasmin and RNaseH domain-containing protein